MSMNRIFITTAIAALGTTGLATSADAGSRYGGGPDVYAYESAPDCRVNPCEAKPAKSSRYGGQYIEQAPMPMPAPSYVDCRQMNACGPQVIAQPTTVYTQPPQPTYQQHAQVYSEPAPAPSMPVNCPAGTTAQPDGTCLQTSGSYGSTSTYSSSTTYGSSSDYSNYDVVIDPAPAPSMPLNCPAGTKAQPDGTCMQTGSTYGSSTSTYSSTTTYSGDAAPMAQSTTSTPTYGYTSDGAYRASDYLPTRK